MYHESYSYSKENMDSHFGIMGVSEGVEEEFITISDEKAYAVDESLCVGG